MPQKLYIFDANIDLFFFKVRVAAACEALDAFSRVDSLRPDYYVDFENGSVDSQLLTSWIFLALKSENTVVEI